MKTSLKTTMIALTLCVYSASSWCASISTPDTTKIWISPGKPGTAKEQANKRIVLAWLHEFWQGGHFESWPKYMRADFVNHDPREPLHGAQALADWLKARLAESKTPVKFPRPDMDHLFLIADGDLVVIVGSPSLDHAHYADLGGPVADLAGNIIRMQQGKVAEWWYIGGISPAPSPTSAPGSVPATDSAR